MDMASLSLEEWQASRQNLTVSDADHEHFQRCWSRQTCGACLDVEQCSWCPYVSPLFAPFHRNPSESAAHTPADMELRPQLAVYPRAGARLQRGHLPALGGALGGAHPAVGVSRVDRYQPNGCGVVCVGAGRGRVRGRGCVCCEAGAQVQRGASGVGWTGKEARGRGVEEEKNGRGEGAAVTGGRSQRGTLEVVLL